MRRREQGEPTSSNGASSFHAHWELPAGSPTEFVEAAATIEVLDRPQVDRLYFWALQVSFVDRGRRHGGAHVGLQWHHSHPGSTAVNWGGYGADGVELTGSESVLSSATNNANTRSMDWSPGLRYRLRVGPGEPGWWPASITDLDSGTEVPIRALHADGRALAHPVVWSEVFARCEHPSVRVRWSDLTAVTAGGDEVRPAAAHLTYQEVANGGCSNTDTSWDGTGVVQTTATPRLHTNRLELPEI
ncbi:MAG: hypothetical protein GY929_19780 [Actinomycetia bacterium]|nr:hypothetical protein [Actinomycetes bacterium]